jgi:membrane protein
MGKAMARAEAERGREADYPSEVPASGWRDILLRAWEQVGTDNISMIAAGVAFYGLRWRLQPELAR